MDVVGLVAVALEDAPAAAEQINQAGTATDGMPLVKDITTAGAMQGPEVAVACLASAGGGYLIGVSSAWM